ncbi:unnamed protein product [Triticum turgidum subsp. durum]|uniref:FBD domain-containing protein n=1 Tax=Triticum turgidum subsp. durum TaxID=4567 RepID=A0A9R0W0M6_TRITD|nr:unnamed protein product [Triticum turgidum subsp. durum]
MLPSFLRCFPNVERLHLESNETEEPTGKLSNKFWQEVGAIECMQSHMKLMVFYGFRGERGELSFLKFVLESARILTKLVIVFTKGSFSSMAEGKTSGCSASKQGLISLQGTHSRAPLLFVAATSKEKPGVCGRLKRGFEFSTR